MNPFAGASPEQVRAALRRSGKTATTMMYFLSHLDELWHGWIDESGWPTRDAAAPEEDG